MRGNYFEYHDVKTCDYYVKTRREKNEISFASWTSSKVPSQGFHTSDKSKGNVLKNVDVEEEFNPMNVRSPSRRHVITVDLAGKVSFVYSCLEARLMVSTIENHPLVVSKPLIEQFSNDCRK